MQGLVSHAWKAGNPDGRDVWPNSAWQRGQVAGILKLAPRALRIPDTPVAFPYHPSEGTMRTRQGQKVVKLLALRQFIHENAARFPRTCACPALREFDELLLQLRSCYEGQEQHRIGAMSATQTHIALRQALIMDHIKPVVAVARLRSARIPGLTPFKMPRGNPSPSQLAAFAHGLAQSARSYMDVFVTAGLEPDFDVRLNHAADAMLATRVARTTELLGGVRSATGIDHSLRMARDIVELLTVFVRKDAAGDVALLGQWRMFARPRAPRRLGAPSTTALVALPASASGRLLSSGTSAPVPETTTAGTSRPGLLGSISRLLRPSMPSHAGR